MSAGKVAILPGYIPVRLRSVGKDHVRRIKLVADLLASGCLIIDLPDLRDHHGVAIGFESNLRLSGRAHRRLEQGHRLNQVHVLIGQFDHVSEYLEGTAEIVRKRFPPKQQREIDRQLNARLSYVGHVGNNSKRDNYYFVPNRPREHPL